MYVRTIAFHEPTGQVWHFDSELEVGDQPDDVLRAAIEQTAHHDREGLSHLIPDQYLPNIEWYATATAGPPGPIEGSSQAP